MSESQTPAGGGQAAARPAGGGRPVSRPRPIDDVHIDELLDFVVEKNASDIHLSVDLPPVVRIDGDLKKMNYEPFTPQNLQTMLYSILRDDQIQRFEEDMELDFSYSLQKKARFRVNFYRDRGNCAAAFRLIPAVIPTVEQLGLSPVVKDLARRSRGLVLVTGPTGSGKSTTLAAMVNVINMEMAKHVLTIEDPIEYLHTHKRSIVNQRELGQDTKSFNNALRASLREDPDVILVGEMRDHETMALAITAAETGHLVMSTLHTNTAADSVDRVIDVFPPGQQEQVRVQLSNNLVAILSQQLIPRATEPGRVCAMEICIANAAIRNLIREAKAHQVTSIIQTHTNIGMQTMDQALKDLYQRGLITWDSAVERCVNRQELEKMIMGDQESAGR
ncbi:MAG: PilT/PilU family type 4a pilus ATPase [Armatimonadia bacterium]|nr:PilT/PilU family type 4a pilus ATPase [Armatimonadia bacterium]